MEKLIRILDGFVIRYSEEDLMNKEWEVRDAEDSDDIEHHPSCGRG